MGHTTCQQQVTFSGGAGGKAEEDVSVNTIQLSFLETDTL